MAVRSKPSGPVMRTRTPPRNGSVEIQASYGRLTFRPAATTAASMRSRRVAGMPLQSKTVSGKTPVSRIRNAEAGQWSYGNA